MTSPIVPTVMSALGYLATLDGSDAEGFMAGDEPLAHTLLAWEQSGRELSDTQLASGYRLLSRYTDQLYAAGIRYDDIPKPRDLQRASAETVAARIAASNDESTAPYAYIEAGRIMLRSEFRLRPTVKVIPNERWDPKRRRATFPVTAGQAATIRDALAGLGLRMSDEVADLCAKADAARAARVHRVSDDLPDIPIQNLPAWSHQKRGFWFAKDQPAVMLALGMGCGKTKITIDVLQNTNTRRVLIVCPSKVLGVWAREFGKHAHPNRPWHVVTGIATNRAGKSVVLPVAKRLAQMEQAFFDCTCGKPHAAVMNYDALVHSPLKSWRPKRGEIDAIVYDEIHKIKAPGGSQSMWCASVSRLIPRKMGLTGTMFPQSPLDIYGQYRALDPSIFGTNHRAFMSKYAIERTESTYGGAEYKVVEGLRNEEDLMARVRTIAYEVSSDVLDLPDRIPDVTRAGILTPDAAKIYASLEADMWAEVATIDGGAEISVRNVLGKMIRQQQITGGSVPTDDGQVLAVGDTKAKLLTEVLEETGRVDPHDPHSAFEPVVVFARFRHDLKVIREVAAATGRTYAEISGSRRDGLTENGTMNPDVDLVGVQEQSGGTGVDLTRSRFAVYYSLTFSRADFEQSIFRLDRPGQTRSVLPIHLVCAGTIDEQIYAALSARQSLVDYVLSLKGYQVGNDDKIHKIIPTE